MAAFTVSYQENNALYIKVTAYANRKEYTSWGLIDTGSAKSALTQKVIGVLELEKISEGKVNTALGSGTVPKFIVDVELQKSIYFHGMLLDLFVGYENGPDFLIGMDILSQGNFAITNYNGNRMMSFEIPSHGNIDFKRM